MRLLPIYARGPYRLNRRGEYARRNGGRVVAYATVDYRVYAEVVRLGYRYTLDGLGYPKRSRGAGRGARRILLHRDVLRIMKPKLLPVPAGLVVDHANRDKLDARASNLRLVTYAVNSANCKKHRDGKSPYKCVYRVPLSHQRLRRWTAQVSKNYRKHHLGYFATAEEAYEAVKAKYAELYPGVTLP